MSHGADPTPSSRLAGHDDGRDTRWLLIGRAGAVSILGWIAAVGVVAVSAGCATSPGRSIGPSPGAMPGAVQTGEASWYGKPHHGQRTASGEVFDMYRLTAAHPSLPFGSRVRVTNLRNGRSVEVRVNDRGPIVAGRIIDLSYAAAQELVAVSDGTIPVRIRVLSIPR